MPNTQTQSPPPEKEEPVAGGVEVKGRAEVSVGGDLAGRDVVKTATTNVGFSAAAVQRLVVTVGALVFVTAACFFTGGIIVGGAVIVALDRQVHVSVAAADSMQAKIDTLQALPAGQAFQQTFTEEEINSYWQLIAGPQVGLAPGTGVVRLLDDNKVLIAGRVSGLGNLMLAAVLVPQLNHPGQPFRLDQAAVQVLPLGATSFGWLPLPATLLQSSVEKVNQLFSPGLEFTAVTNSAPAGQPALAVDGVKP
jgi:hypothetical protein